MDNKINLSQLTELFCNVSNLGKGISATFVKNFFETIIGEVTSGGQVRIKGFGVFKQIVINDRESVNVNTGERIIIHGHQKVSFTPDQELKDFINKPFAGFETVTIDAAEAADIPVIDDKENTPREKTVKVEKEDVSIEDNATVSPIIIQHEIRQVTTDKNHIDAAELKRAIRGLRRLLIIVLEVLALMIITYCIWPVNLIHHMRTNTEDVERISASEGDIKVGSVDIVRAKDTVTTQIPDKTDSTVSQVMGKPETTTEIKPQTTQVKEQPKEQKQQQPERNEPTVRQRPEVAGTTSGSNVQKTEFTLTEADYTKPLNQFTLGDTISYRMTNVIITTHILKSGETLTMISQKYYGTKKLWPYIAAYNNISDVNSASVGTRLRIPILVNK